MPSASHDAGDAPCPPVHSPSRYKFVVPCRCVVVWCVRVCVRVVQRVELLPGQVMKGTNHENADGGFCERLPNGPPGAAGTTSKAHRCSRASGRGLKPSDFSPTTSRTKQKVTAGTPISLRVAGQTAGRTIAIGEAGRCAAHEAGSQSSHDMDEDANVREQTMTQNMGDDLSTNDNGMLMSHIDVIARTSVSLDHSRDCRLMNTTEEDCGSSEEAPAALGRDVFPLMTLPAELRNAIYRACLTCSDSLLLSERDLSAAQVHRTSKHRPHRQAPLASNIILACQQVRDEASALLYSENSFLLDLDTASRFFQGLPQRTRSKFQRIEIELTRYDDVNGRFQDICRLALRYCFKLKTLVIRMPLERPLFGDDTNADGSSKFAQAFDVLHWLPKRCEVVLEGDVSTEIEAVVQKTVPFVKVLRQPRGEEDGFPAEIAAMINDHTTLVRSLEDRRCEHFQTIIDVTAAIDGGLADIQNRTARRSWHTS
nr:hypothetical protein CFP56_00408 [Quercus suber]